MATKNLVSDRAPLDQLPNARLNCINRPENRCQPVVVCGFTACSRIQLFQHRETPGAMFDQYRNLLEVSAIAALRPSPIYRCRSLHRLGDNACAARRSA